MKKVHTKIKRKYALSTNKNQYRFFHPQEKPHRPRTFGSLDSAKQWASKEGLKEGNYEIVMAKHGKRFMITPKGIA